jgi:hypothetical protein
MISNRFLPRNRSKEKRERLNRLGVSRAPVSSPIQSTTTLEVDVDDNEDEEHKSVTILSNAPG